MIGKIAGRFIAREISEVLHNPVDRVIDKSERIGIVAHIIMADCGARILELLSQTLD